jgi:hypothetical protein
MQVETVQSDTSDGYALAECKLCLQVFIHLKVEEGQNIHPFNVGNNL